MSELFGKELYGKVCIHGSLARSCNVCDLQEEIERLKDHIRRNDSQSILVEKLQAENKRLTLEVEKMKEECETLLWNLAGCDTFALGYGIDGPLAMERARPALLSVLKLAKTEKRMRGALEKIQKVSARYLWVMKIKEINGIANLVLSPSNDGREA